MKLFYLMVIIVFLVILILSLTFIGVMMRTGTQTQKFPPNISQCPDMWIPDGSFCHFNGVNYGTYGVSSTNKRILTENNKPYSYTENNKPPLDNPVPFFTYGGDREYIKSTTIDSFDPKWSSQGLSTKCSKKKWANKYGIQWTGISQNNEC